MGVFMRSLMVAALLALAAVAPSRAADRVCTAKSAGPLGDSVEIDLSLGADNAVVRREAGWTPPSKSKAFAPMLSIYYALDGEKIGPATGITVAGMIEMDKLPKDDDAAMVIRLDGDTAGASLTRWKMYHDNIKSLRAGAAPDVPTGGKAVGFVGMVPIAGAGNADHPAYNAELLTKIENAKVADVLIVGAKITRDAVGHTNGTPTDTIASKQYDLSDHAARGALFHKAWEAAMKMAQNPSACGKEDQ